MDENEDAVGYGKPPKKSQFKKGQSGNPTGRPKGARSFKTLVLQGMDRPVVVRKGDVKKTMPYRKALADKVLKDAYEGDPKARAEVIQIDDQWRDRFERERSSETGKRQAEEAALNNEVLSFMPVELLRVLILIIQTEQSIKDNLPRLRELRLAEQRDEEAEIKARQRARQAANLVHRTD